MLGALIGAALSIGGSLIGGNSSKKAANKAADAQLQVADKNNALIRDLYSQNVANFQPNLASGNRANALLDSFIYGAPQGGQATQQVGPAVPANDPQMGGVARPDGQAPSSMFDYVNDPTVPRGYNIGDSFGGYTATNARGARNLNVLAAQEGGQTVAGMPTPGPQTTPGINPAANGPSGFDQFVASPFYQFPYEQGMNALNHGLASGGMLNSGAAMKDAMRFGQGLAFQQGLQPYLGLVEGQVNRGAGAASSIAGVSQNYGNAASANNQNAANALSNSAIAKGVANNQMWSGIGNALGNFASSYRGF